MNRNWKKYNESLVRRGEIMLSFDAIDSWSTELKEMNHKKEGHQFVYPESFMEALGCCHLYLHLPFRQTEGLIKSHLKKQIKNTDIFCHLEACQQTQYQDESKTGRRCCYCN